MSTLKRFGTELLWTMIWVFLVLIVGFAILSWINTRFSGNFLGNTAGWIGRHAEFNQ